MSSQARSITESSDVARLENVISELELSGYIEGNLDTDSEVGIILPTFCEAQTIENVIREIEHLKWNVCILVVDDSSPDGTADVVRVLQKEYGNILLFVRPKKHGLGTAITDGLKVLLFLKNQPRFIVTINADYSHKPEEISKLIRAAHEDCDLVIGSRYCKGGRTVQWTPMRLLLSKIANTMASLVIGARIHDYTSGMRCYSANLVRSMINSLHSQTYEIQIETIRQAHMKGFGIREIPITFANRKKGKSKLSINEIGDFLTYIRLIEKM